jgi:uncharacterized membrane protein
MALNWPHVHLMLNHIPVLGALFGLVLLVAGMYTRKEDVIKAALATFFVTGIFAVITYLTGEPAADAAKDLPCVAKNLIEEHEDFAMGSMIGASLLGLFSAGVLLRDWRGNVGKTQITIALLAALALSGAMAVTAELGGRIHHEELRPGYSIQTHHAADDDE